MFETGCRIPKSEKMKILVGYVASSQGEAALHKGIEEARLRNAELVVVHAPPTSDRLALEQLDEDRAQIEMLRRLLRNEGIPHEVLLLPSDSNASEEIIRLATVEGIDLIVIGIRRRSTVGKLLLGSTAQDLLLNAPCPVLSVHAG